MAIGSIGPAQPNQQIGPASSQPLTLQMQYSQANLKRDVDDERAAWMATDTTRVASDNANIRSEMPSAGLPAAQASRILQDAANPGPTALAADSLYLSALTAPDSALSASTVTYRPANLSYLNGSSSDNSSNTNFGGYDSGYDSDATSAGSGLGYGSSSPFNAPSNSGASPSGNQNPALSNLPAFGSAGPN